jgi:uncharacterized membrane protein
MRLTQGFRRWPASLWLLCASGLAFAALLHLHRGVQPNATQTTTAWLLTIGCFLLGCHQLDREAADPHPFPLTWARRDTVVLSLLVLLALVLRTVDLAHIPLAMHNDEAAMAMEAVNVIEGSLSNPFAIGWYSHPTLWFYLVSFSLRLFGETLTGARLVSALVGTVGTATLYLMARLYFNRQVAVLATFLLTTYHFHIHFSRIALNNIVDPTLGALIFSCLFIAIRTRRVFWFGLSGVVLGLSLYFYMGTRLFILLALGLGGLWWVTQGYRQRANPSLWWALWVMITGFVFVASPLLQTFYRDPEYFLIRTRVVMLRADWIATVKRERGWTTLQFFWDQIQNSLLIFFNRPDVSDFYDHKYPLLHGLTAGLTLLGLVIAAWRLRQGRYQVLIGWSALAIIFGGVLMLTPRMAQRYVTLAPVVCLLMAIALDELATNATALWPKRKQIVQFALAVLVLYLGANSVRQYFFDYIPRETFGNFSSQAATVLARYLQTQPTGTEVWFLGEPWISYSGFPILRFHAPNVIGRDLPDLLTDVTTAPPALGDAPTIYVAVPNRMQELARIEAAYPGGQPQPLYWPKRPEPVLYVYWLYLPYNLTKD